MEISEEVIQTIVDNKDKNDNDILGLIIGLGVPFNKAKTVLNKILIDKGLRMTKADRDTKAEQLMEDFSATSESTVDEVNDKIEQIMEDLDCTVGVAKAYVRAAFAAEELEMPKATRTGGTRGPRTPGFAGDVAIAANFALANPEPTENDLEDFRACMKEQGSDVTASGKDKATRWYGAVVDLRIFGKKWADAHC